MQPAHTALLPDRGVVRVTGEDAGKLLQGVITNDMDLLATQLALHAGLLTPQGKILFEFFVVKTDGGFLLETGRDKAADLAKRLSMYKLRAKAVIADASADFRVFAVWGTVPSSSGQAAGTVSFADPRHPDLGLRILAPQSATNSFDATPEAYHAHRIALGVPEGGRDYVLGDTFPHEADFDVLHGASFTKGCFVGQEVVSRMQNRGTVRKRVVPVTGAAPLAAGADVTTGAAVIGKIGSVAGTQALALLRLDRVDEATAKGEPVLAGGVPITVRKPEWLPATPARLPAEAP